MKQPISSTLYEMDYQQARKPITNAQRAPQVHFSKEASSPLMSI